MGTTRVSLFSPTILVFLTALTSLLPLRMVKRDQITMKAFCSLVRSYFTHIPHQINVSIVTRAPITSAELEVPGIGDLQTQFETEQSIAVTPGNSDDSDEESDYPRMQIAGPAASSTRVLRSASGSLKIRSLEEEESVSNGKIHAQLLSP